MLVAILVRLMAFVAIAFGAADAAGDEVVAKPRQAQMRLARMLREADAIASVTANGRSITFVVVERGGQALRLVAKTRDGEVTALAIVRAQEPVETAHLTWLASELADVRAITRLDADEDGAVTITTSNDRRYMIIPGRGSGGSSANEAVEARWAAAWNRTR